MTSLDYDRRGSGPPLLLIHGIGSRWQVWTPILDLLSAHRDVIAVDLPGFGASPLWPPPTAGKDAAHPDTAHPDEAKPAKAQPDNGHPGTAHGDAAENRTVPGSVPHLADLVESFLDSLGLDTVDVGGSSMGGGIALELGRRGRAHAVTAFSPVGFWPVGGGRWGRFVVGAAHAGSTALASSLPRLMATRAGRTALCAVFYAHPGSLDPADCLADARALAGAPGFRSSRSAFRHLTPWSSVDPGALSRIPVTIAWGTRDVVLPYRNQALRTRTVLPAARHVPLPGCGHLPFPDAPRRCADLLLHPAGLR
ncbi:hydrolase [Actinoplanes cyaneus]|uniref:Hydrolase n=1 Tax=Actinoplanes cyaneus TaxID=52696 RepID=A0A919INN2_9ACTN|nr:alpha/beta fold hydrolase [Actinoplanes cyaneus]MCW2135595.1 Pimeloyl-ACP methyl ester carboxylesterase [Actinoplanes cyaneus]GID69405.1 hydrolase [Actinoplanes cyaneus]